MVFKNENQSLFLCLDIQKMPQEIREVLLKYGKNPTFYSESREDAGFFAVTGGNALNHPLLMILRHSLCISLIVLFIIWDLQETENPDHFSHDLNISDNNRLQSVIFRLKTDHAFLAVKGFYSGAILDQGNDHISVVGGLHLLN